MADLNKRRFFQTSILLACVALVTHAVARDQFVKGSHRKAELLAAAQQQQTSYIPDAEVARLSGGGHSLNQIGLVFTFSSLACVALALLRHEPGWYSIPVMLLVCDLVVQKLL